MGCQQADFMPARRQPAGDFLRHLAAAAAHRRVFVHENENAHYCSALAAGFSTRRTV